MVVFLSLPVVSLSTSTLLKAQASFAITLFFSSSSPRFSWWWVSLSMALGRRRGGLQVRELPPGVRGARQPSIRDWAGLGSAAAAAEQGRRRDGEASGQPLRLVRVRNPW